MKIELPELPHGGGAGVSSDGPQRLQNVGRASGAASGGAARPVSLPGSLPRSERPGGEAPPCSWDLSCKPRSGDASRAPGVVGG